MKHIRLVALLLTSVSASGQKDAQKIRKSLEGAVFFEMAAEIRQEKFDHAKLAPVNVEGRARPLLEYLSLIRDKAKKQQKD